MKRESVRTAVLCRVYAILLYAYPKEFRKQFGGEMRQIFLDRWRAASAPRMLFFSEMAKDWILSSSKERMANMKMASLRSPLRNLAVAAATLLVCLFVSTAFLHAYVISSASMEGSLQIGDHILVGKVGPGREIRRDGLVTFRYPTDESKIFVKRVIGLPGDHIRLAGKQVIRNGRRLSEPYVQHNASRADAFRDNFPADPPTLIPARGLDMLAHHVSGGEVIVPAGSLFVLGDNRDDSADSRYWGFVPRENVVGRPLLVYLSYAGTRIRWNRTLHFLGSAPPTELQP